MGIVDEETLSLVNETSGAANDDDGSETSSSSDFSYGSKKYDHSTRPSTWCRTVSRWILLSVLALSLTVAIEAAVRNRSRIIPFLGSSPPSDDDDDDDASDPSPPDPTYAPTARDSSTGAPTNGATVSDDGWGDGGDDDEEEDLRYDGDGDDDDDDARNDRRFDDDTGSSGDGTTPTGAPTTGAVSSDDAWGDDAWGDDDGGGDGKKVGGFDDIEDWHFDDDGGPLGDGTTPTGAPTPGWIRGTPTTDAPSSDGGYQNHPDTTATTDDNPTAYRNADADAFTLSQRRCSASYRTPREQSAEHLRLYSLARKKGFGQCGGEKQTSLSATADRFAYYLAEAEVAKGGDGEGETIETGWMWLRPARRAVGVRHVTLPFDAVDGDGTPRTTGGDEFVLTFRGRTRPTSDSRSGSVVVVKTSTVARDRGDGVYYATLAIPDVPFQKFELTLMHYYGCYQGFYPGYRPESDEYLRLESGPIDVTPHFGFTKLVPGEEDEDRTRWNDGAATFSSVDRSWKTVPECDATQLGMDHFTDGIWAERLVTADDDDLPEITEDAVWQPLCCRTPRVDDGAGEGDEVRIGGSAVPYPTIAVGDVYDVTKPSHDTWIDYLWNLRNEDYDEGSVLVLSGGRDYIEAGYNPRAATELVTRMLCQVSVLFPGKLLWIGDVPIHQQLYSEVYATDRDVRTVDAVARTAVESNGGRLVDICADSSVRTLYGFVDDSVGGGGGPAAESEAVARYQNLVDLGAAEPHSDTFEKVALKMRKTSSVGAREEVYGDRRVSYADTYRFLRPRPETDIGEDEKLERGRAEQLQVFKAHDKFVEDLIDMRYADAI